MTKDSTHTVSEKKVALVTGGTGTLGQAIARELGTDHHVALHYWSNAHLAHQVRQTLSASLFREDLTLPGAPDKLINDVIASMGRLDVLVNGAALFVKDTGDAAVLAKMKLLNIDAPCHCIRSALPELRRHRGVIVNLGDIAAFAPYRQYIAYSKTKTALVNFARAHAVSYGATGVRINTVCPGIIDDLQTTTKHIDRIKQKIPLGCFGSPWEVAQVVGMLTRSPTITGQVIAVDGGYSLTRQSSQ